MLLPGYSLCRQLYRQLCQPVRDTYFIIVPGNHFYGFINGTRQCAIYDRRMGISRYIGRYVLLIFYDAELIKYECPAWAVKLNVKLIAGSFWENSVVLVVWS
jgi:hypothetical protein